MTGTRVGNKLLLVILIAIGLAGFVTLGPGLVKDQKDDMRKVTFYGQVGDGKAWAGGFTLTVTVNNRSTPYNVAALPPNQTAINTYMVTKTLKVGTSVGVLVTAEWPGRICKAQLRGFGVDTRPAIATSPLQPYAYAIVK